MADEEHADAPSAGHGAAVDAAVDAVAAGPSTGASTGLVDVGQLALLTHQCWDQQQQHQQLPQLPLLAQH